MIREIEWYLIASSSLLFMLIVFHRAHISLVMASPGNNPRDGNFGNYLSTLLLDKTQTRRKQHVLNSLVLFVSAFESHNFGYIPTRG